MSETTTCRHGHGPKLLIYFPQSLCGSRVGLVQEKGDSLVG